MGDYLKRVFTQIGDFISSLTPAKKIAMAVTGGGIVATLVGLFFWAGNTTYTNLDVESHSRRLDENHQGSSRQENSVPCRSKRKKHHRFRPRAWINFVLELATNGLPESSVVGYEVFDKTSLGYDERGSKDQPKARPRRRVDSHNQ